MSKVPNRPSFDGKPRKLEKLLTNNGFVGRKGNGDHMVWRRESEVITIGLSNIENKLVWKLIRKYNLKWEDLF